MKKVLITGCRGGIGLDSAVALSKLGYKVYATVHREESVEELKTFAAQQGIEL
jgi:NAD(P)-dependent dehydrogenase (short-subunit alcohol dehydrogenase family)